jgi:hypothetical protein
MMMQLMGYTYRRGTRVSTLNHLLAAGCCSALDHSVHLQTQVPDSLRRAQCLLQHILELEILRAFGFGTMARQWIPSALLLSLAVAPLLLLTLCPALYKRHRTKVALFNRIMRLCVLTHAAAVNSPGLMDIMSQQHRSAANCSGTGYTNGS